MIRSTIQKASNALIDDRNKQKQMVPPKEGCEVRHIKKEVWLILILSQTSTYSMFVLRDTCVIIFSSGLFRFTVTPTALVLVLLAVPRTVQVQNTCT